MNDAGWFGLLNAMMGSLLLLSVTVPAQADYRGTLKLVGGERGGVVYANKAQVDFSAVMRTVKREVHGKVTWMAMENIDGCLFHMATVARKDRVIMVVTVDSGNGKVVAVEPLKRKGKVDEGGKEGKSVPFKGTLKAVGTDPAVHAYQAKVSIEKAMSTARKAHPGKFYEVYIYEADGWLFYGIEIALKGKDELIKMDVDAGTGKIVNTEKM